jgi:hypothetical protein
MIFAKKQQAGTSPWLDGGANCREKRRGQGVAEREIALRTKQRTSVVAQLKRSCLGVQVELQ